MYSLQLNGSLRTNMDRMPYYCKSLGVCVCVFIHMYIHGHFPVNSRTHGFFYTHCSHFTRIVNIIIIIIYTFIQKDIILYYNSIVLLLYIQDHLTATDWQTDGHDVFRMSSYIIVLRTQMNDVWIIVHGTITP